MISLRISIAILLIVSAVSTSVAQAGWNIDDHLLIRESRYFRGDPGETKYEGSPYLIDAFEPAYVFASELKFTPVSMRYNIFEDVMEYQVGNMLFLLEPDPKITRINLGDRVFVVASTGKNQFYQLEEEGNLSLLSRKVVNYRPKNDITSVPAKYTRQADVFYLRRADGTMEKVSTQKALIGFLPEKHPEVAAYLKNENLSVKSGDDLKKLVKFYNSLDDGSREK